MMYTGGMPELTPAARLAHRAALDLADVHLTPADAAARGAVPQSPEQVMLLSVMGRPAYRFDGVTVFADTGEPLPPLGPEEAREVARRFTEAPASAVAYDRMIAKPDQWMLIAQQFLPAHKLRVSDRAGTELYVEQRTAEVAMVTTRRSRALAWIGAIPHWFYLPALRIDRPLWEAVIVWTSAVGCLIAVTGLLLGATQFRWRRARRAQPRIPYFGWLRWHYLTGVVFGFVTLTWVFSGMLSVQPFAWMTARGFEVPSEALGGGALVLGDFPPMDGAAWERVTSGREIKAITLLRLEGEAHYEVHLGRSPEVSGDRDGQERLVLAANTLQARREPVDAQPLLERLRAALPAVPIDGAAQLDSYDGYYYGRGPDRPPLPVIRVRFADPMRTWIYVDPVANRIVGSVHRYSRLERWLFNGLHSLDFAFWYDRRPLWDVGLLVLMLGGLASSGIGLWLGVGRVRRAIGR
ncbi:MAG: hypothetical protein OXH04_15420 [Acidobacteria bacterium]|nr:hypothetical protein [Acidobacteriota bacterium]